MYDHVVAHIWLEQKKYGTTLPTNFTMLGWSQCWAVEFERGGQQSAVMMLLCVTPELKRESALVFSRYIYSLYITGSANDRNNGQDKERENRSRHPIPPFYCHFFPGVLLPGVLPARVGRAHVRDQAHVHHFAADAPHSPFPPAPDPVVQVSVVVPAFVAEYINTYWRRSFRFWDGLLVFGVRVIVRRRLP